MSDFPPETYLAAARMIPVQEDHVWRLIPRNDKSDGFIVALVFIGRRDGDIIIRGFDTEGQDYRALREALDKEYGIAIHWANYTGNWASYSNDILEKVEPMGDDDIVNLMLRIVHALREAGEIQ